jgi:hypothetical protein
MPPSAVLQEMGPQEGFRDLVGQDVRTLVCAFRLIITQIASIFASELLVKSCLLSEATLGFIGLARFGVAKRAPCPLLNLLSTRPFGRMGYYIAGGTRYAFRSHIEAQKAVCSQLGQTVIPLPRTDDLSDNPCIGSNRS